MTQTLTDRVEQLASKDASDNTGHERQRFDRYVALLAKGDKATKAEAEECYQLMQTLGFTTSNTRRHCEVLRDFQRFHDAYNDSIEARRQAEDLDDEIERRAKVVQRLEQTSGDPTLGPIPDEAVQRAEELRRSKGETNAKGLDGLNADQRDLVLREVLSEWTMWADGPRSRKGDLHLKSRDIEKWRAECDALRKTHPKLIESYERQLQ